MFSNEVNQNVFSPVESFKYPLQSGVASYVLQIADRMLARFSRGNVDEKERDIWGRYLQDAAEYGKKWKASPEVHDPLDEAVFRWGRRLLPIASLVSFMPVYPGGGGGKSRNIDGLDGIRCNIEYSVEEVNDSSYEGPVELITLENLRETHPNLALDAFNQTYAEFTSEENFSDVRVHFALPEGTDLTQGTLWEITEAVKSLQFSLELMKELDPGLVQLFEEYENSRDSERPEKLDIVLTPRGFLAETEFTGDNFIIAGNAESFYLCEKPLESTGNTFSPKYLSIDIGSVLAIDPKITNQSSLSAKMEFARAISILQHELSHIRQPRILDIKKLDPIALSYLQEMLAEASTVPFLAALAERLGIPEFENANFREYFTSQFEWGYLEDGSLSFKKTILNDSYSQGILFGQFLKDRGISLGGWRVLERQYYEYINGLSEEEMLRFPRENSYLQSVFNFVESSTDSLVMQETRETQTSNRPSWNAWVFNFASGNNLQFHTVSWELDRVGTTARFGASDFLFGQEHPRNMEDHIIRIDVPDGNAFVVSGARAVYDVSKDIFIISRHVNGEIALSSKEYIIFPADVDEVVLERIPAKRSR